MRWVAALRTWGSSLFRGPSVRSRGWASTFNPPKVAALHASLLLTTPRSPRPDQTAGRWKAVVWSFLLKLTRP
jgi:hypothetical protein